MVILVPVGAAAVIISLGFSAHRHALHYPGISRHFLPLPRRRHHHNCLALFISRNLRLHLSHGIRRHILLSCTRGVILHPWPCDLPPTSPCLSRHRSRCHAHPNPSRALP